MTPRLTIEELQIKLNVDTSKGGKGHFDPATKAALLKALTNRNAPAITAEDFQRVADMLGCGVRIIRAVRKIEAPRGAFDDDGRPSPLYERHVFARNCEPVGKFNKTNPDISAASGYGQGGYGPFSVQYDRFLAACALDPEAAFQACSWGAFQVLGENAVKCGYASAFDMVLALTVSEVSHLECFAAYVRGFGLIDKLRACRPGDPDSCIPFVSGYNGTGFRRFGYHEKLAAAALTG